MTIAHAEVAPLSREFISLFAEEAASVVGEIVPDCEGACLGTSAVIACVLADLGVATTAVRGTYDEHDHWWLETTDLRIDATRSQFSIGADLVEVIADDVRRDEVPYVPERTFPAAWNHDQALEEFARMFEFYDVGIAHGRRALHHLTNFAMAGAAS